MYNNNGSAINKGDISFDWLQLTDCKFTRIKHIVKEITPLE